MKPIEAHSTAKIKAKVTREEQAAHELGHTEFAPGAKTGLVVVFLAVILSVPLVQLINAIRHPEPLVQAGTGFRNMIPSAARVRAVDGVVSAVNLLPSSQQIKTLEEDWEQSSVVGNTLLPSTQALMLDLGQGNEKAYTGREGWLFCRPDLDYVTGPAFLDPRRLHSRQLASAAPQPDPRQAVRQFAAQLGERGIRLVLMPTPVKPMIEPEHFSGTFTHDSPLLNNPSYTQFVAEMRASGVLIYDCSETLLRLKQSNRQAQYLETDTHWTPQAMEQAASGLAAFLRDYMPLKQPPTKYEHDTQSVTNQGDVAMMFKLHSWQQRYKPQSVTIHPVVLDGGSLWRYGPGCGNIGAGGQFLQYILAFAHGLGKAAGFVEQLSFGLKQPVDAILRNDAAAYATRTMLAQELARGHDRLAGKTIVVWQFAVRELALGDWKLIDLKLGNPAPTRFVTIKDGTSEIGTRTCRKAAVLHPGPARAVTRIT